MWAPNTRPTQLLDKTKLGLLPTVVRENSTSAELRYLVPQRGEDKVGIYRELGVGFKGRACQCGRRGKAGSGLDRECDTIVQDRWKLMRSESERVEGAWGANYPSKLPPR